MPTSPTRRDFLQTTAALGLGAFATTIPAFAQSSTRPATNDTRLRVISIGVTGTIGGTDRMKVHEHPKADIVGLCDVDSQAIAEAAKAHPSAFTCADYREAFDKHANQFDAVIVATPDHSHCAIMTLALAKGKHVYGQKPLVHQLEELHTLSRAVKARPQLVTQTGNQRIESPCRRAAVDILKSGTLGKVIEVHISFGASAISGGHYFTDGVLRDPIDPPANINYDLWLNGAQYEPCRPQMVQRQWRSWWNYGGGMIADWIVHLVDVMFYAFPELQSPTQVCSRTRSRDLTHFHADRVSSTLCYPVNSDNFANSNCNFYLYDSGIRPDRKQLGIGDGDWPANNFTAIVCEAGTIVLGPSEPIEVWREGQLTNGLEVPGLPDYESFNHWHAWVDKALGIDTPHHWTPFDIGLRCTEVGLLAIKAAKYPGQILEWNADKRTFTNHKEATKTIVRRNYRKGFEPIKF